ncbi:MAG TPA: transcriptional regulator MraZ [Chloroflexi bacterium]|mgnify:CR=1 FL=1|nr:transcriptional regulator MraZ [Chloroflexota bacterium]
MFLGEFVHAVDQAGRLTIPAKFRDELAGGLVITRGLDRCLAIYPLDEWQKLADQVSALPITNRQARAFRRLVFANGSDLTPDKNGRILIPPRLREFIDLDGDVVITGLNTYVELWHPDDWNQERDRVESDEGSLEAWSSLGI